MKEYIPEQECCHERDQMRKGEKTRRSQIRGWVISRSKSLTVILIQQLSIYSSIHAYDHRFLLLPFEGYIVHTALLASIAMPLGAKVLEYTTV